VKQFHLQADVFVLPSYHIAEAQPLSIIEALNAGTPVIATRHGGIPDMVADGEQAIFVPRSSPQAICDAVTQMSDPAQWTAMSLRARKLFLEKYHPDVVRRQWVELLTTTGNPADAEIEE
jgi:glycosyltransferase involved in cell wall biosynthesis